MKRSTHAGSVVVYKYGTPHWADLDEEGMRQVRLSHNLWNELVAIEKRCDETAETLEQGIARLEEAERNVEEAGKVVSELKKQLMKERVLLRTTNVITATSTELKAARARLNTAKDQRKAVRVEVQAERKTIRTEVNAARTIETGKELYQTWTERGLGWGTYNDVKDRLDIARKLVIQRRVQGGPGEMNFRRWKGEGTLHVQCPKSGDKPRRVEWEITGDHPKHKTLHLRIGRARFFGSYSLKIPFVYHRPLPCAPQDVTDVRVTRRLIGGKPRITIQFSCRVAAAQLRTGGTAMSIRLRWKKVGNDILVAEVVSFNPLPPIPKDLESVIDLTTTCSASVVLPHSYLWPLSRADHVQKSTRGTMLEGIRTVVVKAMQDESIKEIVNGDPSKWRRPAQFVSLAHRVPKTHPLYESLEMWRKQDKHLWTYEANERDQGIARRRDAYRKVAAWLATEAEVFAIQEIDYAELKKRPKESEDSYEQRHGRKQMQMAAPSELRLLIEQAAHKNGVTFMVQGKGGTEHDESDALDSVGSTRGTDRKTVAETGD